MELEKVYILRYFWKSQKVHMQDVIVGVYKNWFDAIEAVKKELDGVGYDINVRLEDSRVIAEYSVMENDSYGYSVESYFVK